MHELSLKSEPRRILVIALRFLGDVLLATPLLHSLKRAYPHSRIDVLVFRNTAGMLEGNPDIEQVMVVRDRPGLSDYFSVLPRIFRRYDLSVAVQTGDRPFLYCLMASKKRIAAVPPKGSTGWWKRFFFQGFVEYDNEHTHTVLQHLKLLQLIHVPKYLSLIPPQDQNDNDIRARFPLFRQGVDYVVLHPCPQWTYKQWPTENWIAIGKFLRNAGFVVVLSGSPVQSEVKFLEGLCSELPEDTVNLAGKVSLAQLARIISGARCFVGPDTGITHLASAVRVPVIALYGPTNPVKWAPWPCDYTETTNPYHQVGDQRVSNVYLVQGQAECVPCDQEGCDRHRGSRSRCLDQLPVQRVENSIRMALKISA